jgi:ATP-dependent Clp protease ATP-binding subunit ClpC
MEEGHLTDSFGRRIDFKNTIVIMTSNLGTQLVKNQSSLGFAVRGQESDYDAMKKQLKEELEKEFRPEFLNRVDDVIIFRPLNREDLQSIIDIELARVKNRLADKNIVLEVPKDAKEFIIDKGFNPDLGARPLRRALEQLIEDPLAEEILRGNFKNKNTIVVKVKEGSLVFEGSQREKEDKVPAAAGAGGNKP